MHNHKGKNNKLMLWMMLPCFLLVVLIFFGGDKLTSSNYLWLIVLGVCVGPHIWMMLRGHEGHCDIDKEEK